MKYTNFIPRADAAFDQWQDNLINKVESAAARLNIPPDVVPAIRAKQARWASAYYVANDPNTRTKTNVMIKQEMRDEYDTAIRDLNNAYLIHNPAMTDADRTLMGLPIHKTTRTPVPPPTDLVELLLRQLAGYRVEATFFPVSLNSAAKERHEAKPFGVRGAELAWAVLPEPPKSLAELVHSVFDTHSPYTFQFDLPDAGKTLYVCARWENTTGQKGPWGDIKSVIIP
jgi:hypothetical protein